MRAAAMTVRVRPEIDELLRLGAELMGESLVEFLSVALLQRAGAIASSLRGEDAERLQAQLRAAQHAIVTPTLAFRRVRR